jgi:hypothetical protein
MLNATIVMTLGAPGCGKSYSRCSRFLVDYWLKEKQGIHYSNFPVNRKRVAAAVAKKDSGPEFETLVSRIQVIPESVLKTWMSGESGPWEYFADKELDGAHIAIDECHQYIRRHGGRGYVDVIKKWEDWLGTIRHKACTIEFLTQDPHKVAKCIEIHSSVRLQLINSEDRRDPWFGVLLGDWYELRAGFVTGEYETVIWEVEERRLLGRWKPQETRRFRLDPYYFQFYDSFNAASHDGSKPAKAPEREFQKRSRAGLLWWFCARSWLRVALRLVLVAALLWLMSGGGGVVAAWYSSWSSAIAAKNGVSVSKTKAQVAEPQKAAASASQGEPLPGPARVRPKASVTVPTARAEIIAQTPRVNLPSPVRITPSEPLAHVLEEKMVKSVNAPAIRRLVLISRNGAVLSDGTHLKVGSMCGADAVASVDWNERTVVLGSGRIVRVGGAFDEDK